MADRKLYAFDDNFNKVEISINDELNLDSTPTQGSNNPVTSNGIWAALSQKQGTLTFDDVPRSGSENPVKSGGVYTKLQEKQATVTGGATSIVSSNLTASRALVSNASGKVAVSAVTSSELSYLSGVTSAIQTQINAKAALASPTFTGTPKAPTAASGTNTDQIATTKFVQSAISGFSSVAVFG